MYYIVLYCVGSAMWSAIWSRVKSIRRIRSSRTNTTVRWRWSRGDSRGDSNRGKISTGSWSRIGCHRREGIQVARLKNNKMQPQV